MRLQTVKAAKTRSRVAQLWMMTLRSPWSRDPNAPLTQFSNARNNRCLRHGQCVARMV